MGNTFITQSPKGGMILQCPEYCVMYKDQLQRRACPAARQGKQGEVSKSINYFKLYNIPGTCFYLEYNRNWCT